MPRVLVVSALDATVTFFDATTRKRLQSVKVGASPQGITLARNGKYGYVTNCADGTVSVLDVIRMTEVRRLELDGLSEPSGIQCLPDGRSLLVHASGGGRAAVVDAATGSVRRTLTLPKGSTDGFALNSAGDRFWCVDPAGSRVVALDPRTGEQVGSVEVQGGPGAVALARDQRSLLVATREPAALVHVDPDSGHVHKNVEVGRGPVAVAAHPYKDAAFVLARSTGSVFVVDLSTGTAGRPIPVGLSPSAFTVAKAGKVLYVANSESDSLSVLDVAKGEVTDTWDAGHHPSAVAFQS